MKRKQLHRVVMLLGMVALTSCTSSPVRPPTSNAGYARYYFVAPRDTGVFEVTAKPPTLCYSTQSYPARAIALIDESSGGAAVVATYRPSRVQYCDRNVSPELAARLIADPSAFVVRWSPQPGQPAVETHFTRPGQS